MEVKNKKELKKAINENVSPIIITNSKLAKQVQVAFAIKEGRFWEYMGLRKPKVVMAGAIAESTIIALGLIAAITILGIVALIKGKDIRIEIDKNGRLILDTSSKKGN